jgi:RNA polymerase sigma-70 factor (ECF subfamily)
MRLTALLREYGPADTPTTSALSALMCLHAARLKARVDAGGDLSPLSEQDRSRWDTRLIGEGLALLERSAAGTS